MSQIIFQRNSTFFMLFRLYHCLSSCSLKLRTKIAMQIFVILGFICIPMISIAALVLILAVLNLSLGIRRFYVKILAFVFDYATKIKKNKEISIDSDISSTEPSTPQLESFIIENDSIELSSNTSKKESLTDDELDNSLSLEQNQRVPSQTDIQFKLSMNSEVYIFNTIHFR
jgi:hypothetical protein